MESHNYIFRGYNISEFFKGVLDALAFVLLVMLVNKMFFGVADSWTIVKISYYLGAAYMSVRFIEFSNKVLQEVALSGSEE